MEMVAIATGIVCAVLPFLAEAFFPGTLAKAAGALPLPLRLLAPAALCIPYALIASASHSLHVGWLALYASLPVAIAALMQQATQLDPQQKGNWPDYLVLIILGLAVDLRWFEYAWPPRFVFVNKLLLLDAGIYGWLAIRKLNGIGFDLRLKLRDLGIGLREFAFYAPIAIALGLSIGFLHLHAVLPHVPRLAAAVLFTFFLIAVPEELFFRGWLQNLLERRIGRTPALLLTAVLFGLAHWNKRAAHFNWRYVLLAGMAGIFYGRAWRKDRRVGASAITHASVDTVWSFWLR